MNKRLIVIGIVIVLAAVSALAWARANGYHYPCVRCDPVGVVVTPDGK